MTKILKSAEITKIIDETFSDEYIKGFHNGFDTGFAKKSEITATREYADGFDDGLNCARADAYDYFLHKLNRELSKYGIKGLSNERPNIAIENFARQIGTVENHNLDEY